MIAQKKKIKLFNIVQRKYKKGKYVVLLEGGKAVETRKVTKEFDLDNAKKNHSKNNSLYENRKRLTGLGFDYAGNLVNTWKFDQVTNFEKIKNNNLSAINYSKIKKREYLPYRYVVCGYIEFKHGKLKNQRIEVIGSCNYRDTEKGIEHARKRAIKHFYERIHAASHGSLDTKIRQKYYDADEGKRITNTENNDYNVVISYEGVTQYIPR